MATPPFRHAVSVVNGHPFAYGELGGVSPAKSGKICGLVAIGKRYSWPICNGHQWQNITNDSGWEDIWN